jgi:hypothetical protein
MHIEISERMYLTTRRNNAEDLLRQYDTTYTNKINLTSSG